MIILISIDIYNEFVSAYTSYLLSSSTSKDPPSIYITFANPKNNQEESEIESSQEKLNGNEEEQEELTIEIPSSLFILPNYYSNNPPTSPITPPPLRSLCVLTIPEYPSLMILGDVFLQAAIVIHNLTDEVNPTVTIIPRVWSSEEAQLEVKENDNHHPHHLLKSSSSGEIISSLPLTKRYVNDSNWSNYRFQKLSLENQVDHQSTQLNIFSKKFTESLPSILPLQNVLGIQYIAMIEIGTPLQSNIPVIVDTGSGSLVLM